MQELCTNQKLIKLSCACNYISPMAYDGLHKRVFFKKYFFKLCYMDDGLSLTFNSSEHCFNSSEFMLCFLSPVIFFVLTRVTFKNGVILAHVSANNNYLKGLCYLIDTSFLFERHAVENNIAYCFRFSLERLF